MRVSKDVLVVLADRFCYFCFVLVCIAIVSVPCSLGVT